MTNWSPVCLPQWYPNDKYIFKLIYSVKLKRLLTFEEMLSTKAGWIQFMESLNEMGLELVENNSDDIKQLIIEMFELEKDANNFASNLELESIIVKYGSYRGAKISLSLIKKYEKLFDISSVPFKSEYF